MASHSGSGSPSSMTPLSSKAGGRRAKTAQIVLYGRNFFSKREASFAEIISKAEDAIEAAVFPERIVAGSSGSYFVLHKDMSKIAVFKPKTEEPFAHLNPKWPKFFQRVMSPCCFGRRCLLPNQGYLSEAAASLVDEQLGIDLVPKTKVVSLASPTFFYSKGDLRKVPTRVIRRPRNTISSQALLPRKVGSFQLFFSGGDDAGPILRRLGYGTPVSGDKPPLVLASAEVRANFHAAVHKMVALDYIIRNTDRSGANWLIRLKTRPGKGTVSSPSVSTPGNNVKASTPKSPQKPPEEVTQIDIAIIDNGLAFPFKHPEDFRNYPFYWASLSPFCDEPFSGSLRDLLLPKLRSPAFIADLAQNLRHLFKNDTSYRHDLCDRQMNVLRGQIWNLVEALEKGITPRQLAEMRPLVVTRRRLRHTFRSKEAKNLLRLDEIYKVREVDHAPCLKKF